MNNKKKFLALSALVLTGVMGLSLANTASAFQGDYTKKGPNYTIERHEAMQKAFDSSDYNAWKNLMQGRGRVTKVINESNFAKFKEAHNLGLAGKKSEADKIRKELGLRTSNGEKMGSGFGQGRGGQGRK